VCTGHFCTWTFGDILLAGAGSRAATQGLEGYRMTRSNGTAPSSG
jgi:hypothetical protein